MPWPCVYNISNPNQKFLEWGNVRHRVPSHVLATGQRGELFWTPWGYFGKNLSSLSLCSYLHLPRVIVAQLIGQNLAQSLGNFMKLRYQPLKGIFYAQFLPELSVSFILDVFICDNVGIILPTTTDNLESALKKTSSPSLYLSSLYMLLKM